jgi:hypothetical protein
MTEKPSELDPASLSRVATEGSPSFLATNASRFADQAPLFEMSSALWCRY